LAIELLDRGFRRFAVRVFDKRKAARASRLAIQRPNDLRRLTNLREMCSQVVFGGLVGKIAYEKSNWWHGCR
jgi:hypothetical protein